MKEQFERTALLIGEDAVEVLGRKRVAVFGIGGVGGYVVEALARSGIGALDLVDSDKVEVSNLNRQIIATWDTVGMYKTQAAAERVASINPDCAVTVHTMFFLPETKDQFDFHQYDYVVDAIDTVTGKLQLIESAREAGVPIISSMGTGNKMDPTAFQIADIFETSVCPLAKVMRHECRKRGIDHLKVIYSKEEPIRPGEAKKEEPALPGEAKREEPALPGEAKREEPALSGEAKREEPALPGEAKKEGPIQPGQAGKESRMSSRRSIPGSNAFVPASAGLAIAGEVVRDLLCAQ